MLTFVMLSVVMLTQYYITFTDILKT